MSGATWLLLNLILVVAAGVTTVGMRNFTKTKLPDYQIEEKEEKQQVVVQKMGDLECQDYRLEYIPLVVVPPEELLFLQLHVLLVQ